MKERKPRIIVLEIQRLTHSFWKLVDKAEYAFILARVLFIHKRCLEIKTYVVVFLLFYLKFFLLSVTENEQRNALTCKIKSVIEHVVYLVFVDRNEHVARADSCLVGATSVDYFTYRDHFFSF